MRGIRAVAAFVAAGASLLVAVPPASAAGDSELTLTLSERWRTSDPGGWAPYVAAVRNDGASDFAGDVVLSPVESARGANSRAWPEYRGHITVPRGSERSLTFYVVEAPAGYQAALLDGAGRSLQHDVSVTGAGSGAYAVGVLSDQPQAGSRIEALRPVAESGGFTAGAVGMHASRFASAQAFPANAVHLAGLHALVIDDFDVTTLSDAQLRALHDFVGLGGNLVVAGGTAWRRTLLPLADHDLGGLRPQRTDQLPLQPLADLVGRSTSLTVAAGVGDLKAGAAVLGSAAGPPLAVESAYGAGRVIDLAFDPLDQSFVNDDTGMAGLAWSFALDRALLSATSAGNRGVLSVTAKPPVGPSGVILSPEEVMSLLSDTPAAQAPPVGVLGGLLVFYVLLAGPLNYVALKAIGRRELMWATIPALALLFTASAYVWGAGVHGSAYFDSEVQVLRAAPDGALETHGYHGVFSPRRGDFSVGVPANMLASSVLSSFAVQSAQVDTGSRTQVELRNTTYGSMRTVQTLSVTRAPSVPAVGIEAHLRLVQGRVQGTVKNTGDRTLESLELVSGTGQVAVLAEQLAPRAMANVDRPLLEPGTATNGGRGIPPRPNQQPSDFKREAMLRIAAGEVVTGRPGELAVVGLTRTTPELTVVGSSLSASGIAALVQPVRFEATDALSGVAPRPELVVGSAGAGLGGRDVFDIRLPAGYTGPVRLAYFGGSTVSPTGPGTAVTGFRSIEVYDWSAGTWSAVTFPARAPAASQSSVALPPGAVASGVVRVRVDGAPSIQAFSSLLGVAEK